MSREPPESGRAESPARDVYLFTCCTGANGNVGGHALEAFISRTRQAGLSCTARLGVRTLSKGEDLAKRLSSSHITCECVEFDLTRPETWTPAMQGVRAVFLGQPDSGGLDTEPQMHQFVASVEAVQQGTYPLVVRLIGGVLGQISLKELCDRTGCILIEPHVVACRVLSEAREAQRMSVTLVDVWSWYFQNYVSFYGSMIKSGELAIPNADAAVPCIDTRDIGEFVACVLLDTNRYANQDFVLTGAYRLRTSEWARLASQAAGREVRHSTDPGPLRREMESVSVSAGVTLWDLWKPWYEVERLLGDFDVSLDPNVYERVTGRSHRSPEAFCLEVANNGRWS